MTHACCHILLLSHTGSVQRCIVSSQLGFAQLKLRINSIRTKGTPTHELKLSISVYRSSVSSALLRALACFSSLINALTNAALKPARVPLHRQLAAGLGAKVALNNLSLNRHAQAAPNGARRLRKNGKVLRPAPRVASVCVLLHQ